MARKKDQSASAHFSMGIKDVIITMVMVCIDHMREADFFCACCVIIFAADGIPSSIQTFNSFHIVLSFPLTLTRYEKKEKERER